MKRIPIKHVALFCLFMPILAFSQYNEDNQIFSRGHTFDVVKSEDALFHIVIDDTYTDSTIIYEGIKYITVDTLLNQISLQAYPWAKYANYPCIDVKNNLVGIAWLQNRFEETDSIKGIVFNSASELDSNSVICLSDSITFSFSGTTRSTPAISFLNDTLLAAIWIQADPDIDHFSIFGQLFTSSSKLIGSNFKINDQYRSDVDCGFHPVIHPLHSGDGFTVIWMDHPNHEGNLYGRIFNLDGSARDSSFSISADYQYYIAGLYNFSMDLDSSDNILACFSAWDDSYRWNIYYRWFDINGTPLSDMDTINNIPFYVKEMSALNCNISSDGRSIITWQTFNDNPRVFCQRFDQDHSPIGIPFCVSHSERLSAQRGQYSFIDGDQIYSFWNELESIWNESESIWDESRSIWSSIIEFYNTPVSISDNSGITKFYLSNNYPNPFNPLTSIGYNIPEDTYARLDIYSVTGQLVETLVDKYHPTGAYNVKWNASKFSSGIYIYRLQVGENHISRKMLLIK